MTMPETEPRPLTPEYLESRVEELTGQVQHLSAQVQQLNGQDESQGARLEELTTRVQELVDQLRHLSDRALNSNGQLKIRDTRIEELAGQLANRVRQLRQLLKPVVQLDSPVERLDGRCAELDLVAQGFIGRITGLRLAQPLLDGQQEIRQEIRDSRAGQRQLIIATWTVGGGIIITLIGGIVTLALRSAGG